MPTYLTKAEMADKTIEEFGGSQGAFDALIAAMGDVELRENYDYIAIQYDFAQDESDIDSNEDDDY